MSHRVLFRRSCAVRAEEGGGRGGGVEDNKVNYRWNVTGKTMKITE